MELSAATDDAGRVVALALALRGYGGWPRHRHVPATAGVEPTEARGGADIAAGASGGGARRASRSARAEPAEAGRARDAISSGSSRSRRLRRPRARRQPAPPAPVEPAATGAAAAAADPVQVHRHTGSAGQAGRGRGPQRRRGALFHGARRGYIEGRYRILRIGAESIEMAYSTDADGRRFDFDGIMR